jgi:hypothetical protein
MSPAIIRGLDTSMLVGPQILVMTTGPYYALAKPDQAKLTFVERPNQLVNMDQVRLYGIPLSFEEIIISPSTQFGGGGLESKLKKMVEKEGKDGILVNVKLEADLEHPSCLTAHVDYQYLFFAERQL